MFRELTCIVSSKKDLASINIKKNLLELCHWEKIAEPIFNASSSDILFCKEINSILITIENELIHINKAIINEKIINRYIFISRHTSKAGIPALLMHFTGNWTNDSSMGGTPRTLSYSDPILAKLIFQHLISNYEPLLSKKNISISLEATHHGPTALSKPLFFVEIGSNIDTWKDTRLGRIWADTIIEILSKTRNVKQNIKNVALGFGGPHYAPNFNKVELLTDIAMSHIASKYVIDHIDVNMLHQAISRSGKKPNIILLDWKGLSGDQRKRIIMLSEHFSDIEVVRTRDMLKN